MRHTYLSSFFATAALVLVAGIPAASSRATSSAPPIRSDIPAPGSASGQATAATDPATPGPGGGKPPSPGAGLPTSPTAGQRPSSDDGPSPSLAVLQPPSPDDRSLSDPDDGTTLSVDNSLPLALDDGLPLPPLSPDEVYHPYLPPHLTGAISMGTTRDGFLLRGEPLPLDDPDLRVMPRQRAREVHFGTRGLVKALVETARDMAEAYPGSVLSLGDMSARDGGDIPWSVSHNAGRDADIAFYYQDAAGQFLQPDDFVTVNARGLGTDRRYRFDVAHNWLLVKALLTSPDIQVQWLFIYNPLREKLLRYARQAGEPDALIARAAEALRQPSDGAPHNDHLHLRILCALEDVGEGCRDMGRLPSWAVPQEEAIQSRVRDVEPYLIHDDPERRARAVELLGMMRVQGVADEMIDLLDDPSPRVRIAAARGLEALAPAGPITVGPGDLAPLSVVSLSSGPGPQPAASGPHPQPAASGPHPQPVASGPHPQPPPRSGEGAEEEGSFPPPRNGEGGQGGGVSGMPGAEEEGSFPPPRNGEGGQGGGVPQPQGGGVPIDWTQAVLQRLEHERDPAVLEAWVGVLVRAREPALAPLLERWLEDRRVFAPGERRAWPNDGLARGLFADTYPLASRGFPLDAPLPVRALAAAGLEELEASDAVPSLLALFSDDDLEVRRVAAWAVAGLTNRSWPSPDDPEALEASSRAWLEAHAAADRDAWLREGFRLAGYPADRLDRRDAAVLVKALAGPAPVALNAHRTLCRISGTRPPQVSCSLADARTFWGQWLKHQRVASATKQAASSAKRASTAKTNRTASSAKRASASRSARR